MQRMMAFTLGMFLLLAPGLRAQQSSQPLANQDVVSMVKAGLTPEVVVAKIKSSRSNFDTSPSALEDLKKAGVPDSVILAIVEAPRVVQTVYVKCDVGTVEIHSATAIYSPIVAHSQCNQALTVLDDTDKQYSKVSTAEGTVGYVFKTFVSPAKEAKETGDGDQVLHPESTLSPNELRALAWRGVPWATTSYYQQPGSSSTNCTGDGQWLGSIYSTNLSCTGSYTPAQSVPVSWYHYTIYNLVETSDSYLVLSCTRNVAWSKCSYFVPGSVLSYQNKKGQIYVTGQRSGKSKLESLKYEIVATQPK